MNNASVRIENLNKKFRVFHESPLTFQKAAYNFLKGKNNYEDIWALKDVNFSLNKNETVGLIGPNASGKTTLLRTIANIYTPTSGNIWVNGRVAVFLELGLGFITEFTGIENLYLYGAVFGLSRREIKDRMPEIAEFSELHDFLDIPLRQYSFGMRMRLAFSLAVNVDPDILLIDETLSVGDLAFQERCFQKIKELKKENKTLFLVSHNMDEIERLCDRVILLNKGTIVYEGDPQKVISRYASLIDKEKTH